MNTEEFREQGKNMIDYICKYMEGVNDYRVTPKIDPGYLRKLLPEEAPDKPEEWDQIMQDVDSKIMPGVTHWQHKKFNAYFPSGNSYPSILGDMLSDAIGCIGFSWVSSPACTELETIVLDWFGAAMALPDKFLSTKGGGGGVIQGSASECILTCMLAARANAISFLKEQNPEENLHNSSYLPKLVAYCSSESHSSVEKAAMIALVELRVLPVDDQGSLRGDTLEEAMEKDIENGLLPFFVSITLGSTACTSFDNIKEIGKVCKGEDTLVECEEIDGVCKEQKMPEELGEIYKKQKNVWLHVDAAYAGSGFICPELRYLLDGIEYADSYNTNTNKWLLTAFDCSCLWVADRIKLTKGLVVDPLYLQHSNSDEAIDYRHWGIPLSRRFRSLKLWFVLRKYGITGLQKYIRNHIALAKKFEGYIKNDKNFVLMNNVRLGLVCFRMFGSDKRNQDLINSINESGDLFLIPALVKGKFSIRFCVVSENATEEDIVNAWEVISKAAAQIRNKTPVTPEAPIVCPAHRQLSKQLSRQFSFTRSVSRDVYQRSHSRTSLHDGATPILVPEDEENEIKEAEEDVFTSKQVISALKIYNNKCKENGTGPTLSRQEEVSN